MRELRQVRPVAEVNPLPMGIRPRRQDKRHGFTLIELLVVVAIIGILASIMLLNLFHAIRKAREARTYSHLNTTRTAINMFRAMEGAGYHSGSVYPGSNSTNGNPWALKENPGDEIPPVAGDGWADEDGVAGWRTESGKYGVYFNKYLQTIPRAEVSLDGAPNFTGGQTNFINGVWHSNIIYNSSDTGFILNNRGWWYCNTAGVLLINNNSASTEGKRYIDY